MGPICDLSSGNPVSDGVLSHAGSNCGILKQMQEEFEASLSQAQKDELKAKEDRAAFFRARSKFIQVNQAHRDRCVCVCGCERALGTQQS